MPIITVQVKPASKKVGFLGQIDRDTMRIGVKAPAKEGRANVELIERVAELANCPKSHVELVRGHKSKAKHIRLTNSAYDSLRRSTAKN
jgi:uncharacterized protein (TIGR00251 family)